MAAPLPLPEFDPTSIFEHYRGSYGTALLTAAVAHFKLFDRLADGPLTESDLAAMLELQRRPANVLFTALRAMNLLERDEVDSLRLSPLARANLLRGGEHYVGDYLGLSADSPAVLAMYEALKSNRPAGSGDDMASDKHVFAPAGTTEQGVAFIYKPGEKSAMEEAAAARTLTLALSGRARNVAPVLAQKLDLSQARSLLDVGGGSGIYSIALLRAYPELHAVVWDRPEVLNVAREFADHYGVTNRLYFVPGDMFQDTPPADADVVLLSNILHDWAVPECKTLLACCNDALPMGGKLVIHDVFLDDDLGGPLPVALYSAALFSLTEGRAYSAAEYRAWLSETGFQVDPGPTPTAIHCGFLTATKVSSV